MNKVSKMKLNLLLQIPNKIREKICGSLKPSEEEKLFIEGMRQYNERIDLVNFLKQWDAVKKNMHLI